MSRRKQDKPLTLQEIQFCHEYLKDFKIGHAGTRAGYTEGSGTPYTLMKDKRIQQHIDQLMREKTAQADLTIARVIAGLEREATRTGPGTSHGARVTAWTKLGEYLSMFTQNINHSGSVEGSVVKLYLPDNGRDPKLAEEDEDQ